jgi:hypothetical protein
MLITVPFLSACVCILSIPLFFGTIGNSPLAEAVERNMGLPCKTNIDLCS